MPVVPPDPALTGRWRRTLLIRPDGTDDTTTAVTWLQAGTRYVDLRIPADPGIAADGFAGRIRADGTWTCWDRLVDLQPTALPDAGRLEADGPDALVETGRHEAYREHWVREGDRAPAIALELKDAVTGDPAVLVRVGHSVGWARGGPDPEVAVGEVGADGGVVPTAASRPGRRAAGLALAWDGPDLLTASAVEDSPTTRWRVTAGEGPVAALAVPHIAPSRKVRFA